MEIETCYLMQAVNFTNGMFWKEDAVGHDPKEGHNWDTVLVNSYQLIG